MAETDPSADGARTSLFYFHIHVILDIFSRYVVGWMIAPQESADLAKRLIEETCEALITPLPDVNYISPSTTIIFPRPFHFLSAPIATVRTSSAG